MIHGNILTHFLLLFLVKLIISGLAYLNQLESRDYTLSLYHILPFMWAPEILVIDGANAQWIMSSQLVGTRARDEENGDVDLLEFLCPEWVVWKPRKEDNVVCLIIFKTIGQSLYQCGSLEWRPPVLSNIPEGCWIQLWHGWPDHHLKNKSKIKKASNRSPSFVLLSLLLTKDRARLMLNLCRNLLFFPVALTTNHDRSGAVEQQKSTLSVLEAEP